VNLSQINIIISISFIIVLLFHILSLILPISATGQEQPVNNFSNGKLPNPENLGMHSSDPSFPPPQSYPTVSSQLKCKNTSDFDPASISIDTDKVTYAPTQSIFLFVFVYNQEGCIIPAKVVIEISSTDSSFKLVRQSSFSSTQGGLINNGQQFNLEDSGRYNLTATVKIADKEEIAWKIISVKEIFESRQALMWLIGLLFFVGLILVIIRGTRDLLLNEILRFICISGIIFSALSSFIFINENISAFSPIGVVKKPNSGTSIETVTDISPSPPPATSSGEAPPPATSSGEAPPPSTSSGEAPPPSTSSGEAIYLPESAFGEGQWVLNIGGQAPAYSFGIQIPLAVIIFGIAGGYLRYLYKTSKLKNNLSIMVGEMNNRNWRFYHSLEDIALLFLAPLLAIGVWFLLDLAGIKGQSAINTIAVTSLTIGLITEEVIQMLIKFSGSALGMTQKEQKK